jgi:ubiquinone biosynthesis protein UbiJ
MTSLVASPVVAVINHLLKGASWAPLRLAPFAERTVRLASGLMVVRLTITAEGMVRTADDLAADALVIEIPPLTAARLLAGDRAARRDARIQGDHDLAQAVSVVVDQLDWEAEEDLSRVVGDVPAHRLTESIRTFAQWQRSAAENLARNVAEYWVEEDPLIASRHRLREFVEDVDRLRDDVERLAKRLDLLARSHGRTP